VTTTHKTSLGADPFRMTLLIFAVIAFMYFTGEVLKPLALSILLSFALAPATRLLERCGLPRAAAVVLTIVLSLGLSGVGIFVLILVLFMLMGRDGLSDRIVGLVGHRQVSLATRAVQEIGQRISRYLATFALVNSGFGLVIGLGLSLIGAPFAVLWGCLAAITFPACGSSPRS